MRKLLPVLFCTLILSTACSEGNDSADVGDRNLVEPRSLPGASVPPPDTVLQIDAVAYGDGAETLADQPGGTRLIASPEEWRTFWDQVQPTDGNRPDIDFANAKVIVVARQFPSGGHGMDPAEVKVQGNRVLVKLNVTTPGPGCVTTQALEAPWVALRVPYWATGADVEEQRAPGPPC